jgi:ankyrin repeat protein
MNLKKNFLLAKDNEGFTAWQGAAIYGRLEALEILWNWAKVVGIQRDELLLAQTEAGLTALQLAVTENHVGILQKLWVWAEEGQLNSNELKKSLLLAKNNEGYTAWQYAALLGRLESLEILWNWAKETGLNTDEFLFAQGGKGQTALEMAACGNHVEILEKLWVWSKEWQPNSNKLKKNLLLIKNQYGYTAWHRAAEEGCLEALEIWNWAKEVGLNPDELLLAKTKAGITALLMAVQENHTGILQKLWVWAEEGQLNSNELKENLLLAKDNEGFTAWHYAARFGRLRGIRDIMELG